MMVSITAARQLALSFPEAPEQPHFHLASFRVRRKIFFTLHEKDKHMMVKLSKADQSVFCLIDPLYIRCQEAGENQVLLLLNSGK